MKIDKMFPEETDSKEIIEFYKLVGKETTYLGFSDGEYQVLEPYQFIDGNYYDSIVMALMIRE